jgi:hypothetical protein
VREGAVEYTIHLSPISRDIVPLDDVVRSMAAKHASAGRDAPHEPRFALEFAKCSRLVYQAVESRALELCTADGDPVDAIDASAGGFVKLGALNVWAARRHDHFTLVADLPFFDGWTYGPDHLMKVDVLPASKEAHEEDLKERRQMLAAEDQDTLRQRQQAIRDRMERWLTFVPSTSHETEVRSHEVALLEQRLELVNVELASRMKPAEGRDTAVASPMVDGNADLDQLRAMLEASGRGKPRLRTQLLVDWILPECGHSGPLDRHRGGGAKNELKAKARLLASTTKYRFAGFTDTTFEKAWESVPKCDTVEPPMK